MKEQPFFKGIRPILVRITSPFKRTANRQPPVRVAHEDGPACEPAPGRQLDDGRFLPVVDAIPAMIWIVDANRKCAYVNKPWLAFTGRRLDQELGDGWMTNIHPDFKEKTVATFDEAFDNQRGFSVEYRLRCGEGEYRWLMLSGTPRFEANGEFSGMIGIGTDITNRRSAEDDLLDLSGRLINAQEEERSRIARELHDDLSQQMALLSIDLEQIAQKVPDSAPEFSRGLKKALLRAQEVSSELHRMSYEIHPSKLDRLGLAAAAMSLCKEVSKQQSIRLECAFRSIPESLPRDISLCLYRVIQESVRNVVKHSGARYALVELVGSPTDIRLQISDAGVGFNLKSVAKKGGLGLLSMRERLRIVGGTIAIASEPLRGTRVTVTVPLAPAESAFTHEAAPARKHVGTFS